MSGVSPIQSTNLQVQTTQISKKELSNTDRKVSQSPMIRQIITSLLVFIALDILVISCIVTPILLYAAIPAVLLVAYKFFSPSQQQPLPPPGPETPPLLLVDPEKPLEISHDPIPSFVPRSFAGSFTGLNRRCNECFINSALQFLEGSPLYVDIISNNSRFNVLKKAHEGMRAAVKNCQLVANIDTHDVRMWLYELVKGTKNQISDDDQEDTSILLEELFGVAYPDLPFKSIGFRTSQRADERVFVPQKEDKMQWIDLPIDSSNFIENFNAFFWDTPERSSKEIKESKGARNIIRQFSTSPNDFFIRLKRFDSMGNKITKDVVIPEVFYLEKDVHTMGNAAGYELDRFIQHRGNSLRAGHYVTFKKVILDGQTVYIEFDDQSVKEVTKEEYFMQAQQAFWGHACKV